MLGGNEGFFGRTIVLLLHLHQRIGDGVEQQRIHLLIICHSETSEHILDILYIHYAHNTSKRAYCKRIINMVWGFSLAIRGLSIRIDAEMLHKLHVVADYEGRSANNEILILIRDAIEAYEEKHGKIEL